jgi:hypothetical protein
VSRQSTTSSVSASGAGGETANVSPLKAEEPEEVRRIDEDLARLTEAGLAAGSLHSAAVSGKSQVMTWYQTWSHSAQLRDLGGGDRRAIGGGLRQGKITMLER